MKFEINVFKTKKPAKICSIVLIIMGLIFFLFGTIYGYYQHANKNEKVFIKAEIVEIYNDGEESYIKVGYEVDNITYTNTLNLYSSTYYVGKTIEIYYYKNNINKIGSPFLDTILTLVFSLVGFAMLSGGIVIIVVLKNKKNKQRFLLENGIKINATYSRVIENKYYFVNESHPYQIICTYYDQFTGENTEYKSKLLWENPEKIIADRNIQYFSVYVDSNNKKKYYMDISEIILGE